MHSVSAAIGDGEAVSFSKESVIQPPWWINPLLYCMLFLLPLFALSVYDAGPCLAILGEAPDNLTNENIFLGVWSIFLFAGGCLPFMRVGGVSVMPVEPRMKSVNVVLSGMGLVAFICYVIYFSELLLHPQLISTFLSGGKDAASDLRGNIEQIPGLTSFMHAELPFFSLYSASSSLRLGEPVSKFNKHLFFVLMAFVIMRAMMGSERLALVEALGAYGVPLAAFAWRPSLLRKSLPYLGIFAVFILFCAGEYFRSWQYYQYTHDFWEFMYNRFMGYFATSINNGAGLVSNYAPAYQPMGTFDGFDKMLAVFGLEPSQTIDDVMNDYLFRYASLEFNSPGGLYLPYFDYGITGGGLFFFGTGMFTGWLYRRFLAMSPLGLILYPAWFLGLLDIIREWSWGSSRFLPAIVIACLAAFAVTRRRIA